MKKLSIVLTVILFAAASIFLIFANDANDGQHNVHINQQHDESDSCCTVKPEVPKTEKASCCSGDMTNSEQVGFTENSIYQVNSNWTNQFGNKVNIGELKGKTQVFSMIFANCTYACPIIANDMRRIEQALSKDELKNIQFTLISIDPERDTPERLKKFANDQNLNLGKWQLLTGTRNDIDDIAALIGFRYKKENDGSFSHSNIITILNEDGEIIHQQVGLNQDITATLEVIKNHNHKGV